MKLELDLNKVIDPIWGAVLDLYEYSLKAQNKRFTRSYDTIYTVLDTGEVLDVRTRDQYKLEYGAIYRYSDDGAYWYPVKHYDEEILKLLNPEMKPA